ncbi:LOW QUALITY PROTEIN: glucokinase, partial [Streptomyces sp. e14]
RGSTGTEGFMGLTIGVDIGGTKIAAGVVDEEGNILSTFKVPTPTTPEAIVDAIASAVEGARAGHDIVGVGFGAAGILQPVALHRLLSRPTSTGARSRSRRRSRSASASPSSWRTT